MPPCAHRHMQRRARADHLDLHVRQGMRIVGMAAQLEQQGDHRLVALRHRQLEQAAAFPTWRPQARRRSLGQRPHPLQLAQDDGRLQAGLASRQAAQQPRHLPAWLLSCSTPCRLEQVRAVQARQVHGQRCEPGCAPAASSWRGCRLGHNGRRGGAGCQRRQDRRRAPARDPARQRRASQLRHRHAEITAPAPGRQRRRAWRWAAPPGSGVRRSSHFMEDGEQARR